MKFKDIFLAGLLFLASSPSLSQEKHHFDVYSKGEGGFFNPRFNTSSLKVSPEEVDFSFLLGIYSIQFKKLNDSVYQEIVKSNFPLKSNKEVYSYLLRDSSYTFEDYSADNESREEKIVLQGNKFEKKYKVLPELFANFQNGTLGDSLHCIILGVPYSVKIEKDEQGKELVYSCNLNGLIKAEEGDVFLFPYPVKAEAVKENGTIKPLRFSTYFLNAKSGKRTHLEGLLRK